MVALEAGAIDAILAAMRAHVNDEILAAQACWAVFVICDGVLIGARFCCRMLLLRTQVRIVLLQLWSLAPSVLW